MFEVNKKYMAGGGKINMGCNCHINVDGKRVLESLHLWKKQSLLSGSLGWKVCHLSVLPELLQIIFLLVF